MMKGLLRECHLILSAQVSGRQQRPYREGDLRRVSVVRETRPRATQRAM